MLFACWMLESAFCGVQMRLLSIALRLPHILFTPRGYQKQTFEYPRTSFLQERVAAGFSIWRDKCPAALKDAQGLHGCKQVCAAGFCVYLSLTLHIYCCASAEQMEPPCRILFGDICVPHGTHSCSRPALQQTSLQRQFSLILDLVTFPFVQKYECALRHMTSIRSLHNCKLVCIVCDFS